MPRIIAIANRKGGVGKTTTTVNVATAMAAAGKKVLVIDLDPQGNATTSMGINKTGRMASSYEVLLGEKRINEAVVWTEIPNFSLVPSSADLAGAEVELVSVMAREMRLRDIIVGLKDDFDYVFIDCPPSLGLLTVNALTAADSVLIPIQCEYYALEGVTKLLESMKMVKDRLNRHLETFGVLLTMYDSRTTLANQVVDEVRNYFGKKVFQAVIPRSVKVSEAPSFGLPVVKYAPNNKGARAYMQLAREVIRRG